MSKLFVKLHKSQVEIDRRVFLSLLDLSPIKEYVAYQNAIRDEEICFKDLKSLAEKADVPYPLFFAPKDKVDIQIKDKNKNLFEKIPTKSEMQVSPRGRLKIEDIELIIKDLGRKQEFLKRRVLPEAKLNKLAGLVAKNTKGAFSNDVIADSIRSFLEIDLQELRGLSKAGVLRYLCQKAERQSVLVSFSSYNFMPQNVNRDVEISGLCIKDKKFPYIFINTRDGDSSPKILESDGRQIFTLLSMLVCIAMNRFIFSTKSGRSQKSFVKKIYSIVGNILIPEDDLDGVEIKNLDSLKAYSTFFKVTPSMLLVRLRELGLIEKTLSDILRDRLREEIKNIPPSPKRTPLQITGYGKYNGERFSREVIRAHTAGKVSRDEVKNILFRKGKMKSNLFRDYFQKFS